jgi:hypothetical protein
VIALHVSRIYAHRQEQQELTPVAYGILSSLLESGGVSSGGVRRVEAEEATTLHYTGVE